MIETANLILRWHTLEDAAAMMDLNSDPEVTRFTGDVAIHTLEDARKIITERLIPQRDLYKMGRFAVTLKDGTFIGWCGLRYFAHTKEVDLGYRFKKKYWGKGFATETSIACLKYGFEELKLKMIYATAMPDNVGSIKVMQKLGMTFKGVVKDDDDPQPLIRYEITAEEFRSCKE